MVTARRGLGLTACAGLIAFVAGFGWFVRDAERPSPWPAEADGIVALTGGALRIETAMALLRAGVAHRLLISGVGPGVTLPDMLQAVAHDTSAPLPAAVHDVLAAGTVTLGHVARTTRGNAVEITWWVRANGLGSIVVVTAGYHMRRALAVIGTSLPGVRLTPYAVHPPAGIRKLFIEYVKLVAAEAGIPPATPTPGLT